MLFIKNVQMSKYNRKTIPPLILSWICVYLFLFALVILPK